MGWRVCALLFILIFKVNGFDISANCNEDKKSHVIEREEKNYHRCWDSSCSRFYNEYIIYAQHVVCTDVHDNDVDLILKNYQRTDKMYVEITIQNSTISTLSTNTKRNQVISTFFLSHLNISKIVPGFFVGITNMSNLHLEENQLTEIIDGTFSSLSELELLNLSTNPLKILKEHSFSGLISLRTLDVSKNHLSDINVNTFASNTLLQNLNLSSNNLISFTANLTFLTNLNLIDLSENYLKTIMFDVFPSTFMSLVNVSHNNLTVVSNLTHLQTSTIDLSYNQLKFINGTNSSHLFASHNKLTLMPNLSKYVISLDISYNNIVNVTDNIATFSILEYLNLKNNSISEMQHGYFSSMKELQHLDLSNNKLTTIRYGLLDSLANLTVLNIEANLLTKIDVYTLSLGRLEELYVGGNFINDLDITTLTMHAPHLRKISLKSAEWECTKLAKIITTLKRRNIEIVGGNTLDVNNVLGIPCIEASFEKFVTTNEKNDKIVAGNLPNYFDRDFTKTSFYKYLEGLKSGDSLKEFDKDFGKSNIYKYMEKGNDKTASKIEQIAVLLNITIQRFDNTLQALNVENNLTSSILNHSNFELKQTERLISNNSFLDYMGKDFRNTNFYKYLESFKDFKAPSGPDYFDKGFQKSNFYKYLESFKLTPAKTVTAERLVQENKQNNGNGITYVNLLSNLLQVANILVIVYVFMFIRDYIKSRNSAEQNMRLV